MAQQTRPTNKAAVACALLTASIGLFYILCFAGLIPISGATASQDPHWLMFCVGLTFFAGGLAATIQSIGRFSAGPDGRLSPAAPILIRQICKTLALTIVLCLGAMISWVAFGPGTRHFSTNIPFLTDHANDVAGRTVFCFGAVLIWIVLAALAISRVRRVLRHVTS